MKFIYITLIFSIFFVACGYKASPVYVDDKKIEQKSNLK